MECERMFCRLSQRDRLAAVERRKNHEITGIE
jgi:hypothetical protein